VDDEPGVDVGGAAVRRRELVGVGVPAQSVVGLEERDVIAALQQVGGGEPGDAATADGIGITVEPEGGSPEPNLDSAITVAFNA
jgi:hypothetical protein